MQRYDHGGDVFVCPNICHDFSVNLNPLGMPPSVREAIGSQPERFARYPDPRCRALRGALAERHGLREENILCGNGAADLIFRICACLKPKKALVLAPTFSEYERPVLLFGGGVTEYRLSERNGFLLTEEFLSSLTPDVDIVFLCNPNNPTGRLAPEELLERIAARCAENGTVLVTDECFIEFTDGASVTPLLPKYRSMLVLRAFTKLYAMAGLRLGYLLGDEKLLAEIAKFGAEWSVSQPAQTGGLAALFAEPEWTACTRRLVKEERAFLTKGLSALELTVYPSDANFLLFKSERPLHAGLKERGILVRDCSNFTGLDSRYLRIGVKMREENELLLAAIREVLYG